jgi:hypothetical protein
VEKKKSSTKENVPQDADPSLNHIIDAPLTYSYPCEHSVTAAAAAYVLAYFFPEKADSILQIAHAESQSRIEAGVHFQAMLMQAGNWETGCQQIIEKATMTDRLRYGRAT